MDRLNEYKIAHRGLSEGTHTFDFVMDDNFFNCFEATKGTKGKVNARVNIVKSSCLLYTSPSPRDMRRARMPSSA